VSKESVEAVARAPEDDGEENRLNLADKNARDYLAQQMEKCFFGSGTDVAAGYIPPSQQ
jgi:Fe-S cluster biosynthesis and repair protein YggX